MIKTSGITDPGSTLTLCLGLLEHVGSPKPGFAFRLQRVMTFPYYVIIIIIITIITLPWRDLAYTHYKRSLHFSHPVHFFKNNLKKL
jgi:hypothetical protein